MSLYNEVCIAQNREPLRRDDVFECCARHAEEFFRWFERVTEWEGKITFQHSTDGNVSSDDLRPALSDFGGNRFAMNVNLEWDGGSTVTPFLISKDHTGGYRSTFLGETIHLDNAFQLSSATAGTFVLRLIQDIENAGTKPAANSLPTADIPIKPPSTELPLPSVRPVPGANNGTPNPELDKGADKSKGNAADKTIDA
ncbi:MAG: hypothetical protein WCH39_25140 [Schlesneria sp.]